MVVLWLDICHSSCDVAFNSSEFYYRWVRLQGSHEVGGGTPFPKNQVTCIGFLNGGLLVVIELTGSWTIDWGQIWRECVVLNVLWDNWGLCSWKGLSFTKRYCESYKDLCSWGIEPAQDLLSTFWDGWVWDRDRPTDFGKGPCLLLRREEIGSICLVLWSTVTH